MNSAYRAPVKKQPYIRRGDLITANSTATVNQGVYIPMGAEDLDPYERSGLQGAFFVEWNRSPREPKDQVLVYTWEMEPAQSGQQAIYKFVLGQDSKEEVVHLEGSGASISSSLALLQNLGASTLGWSDLVRIEQDNEEEEISVGPAAMFEDAPIPRPRSNIRLTPRIRAALPPEDLPRVLSISLPEEAEE